MSAGRIVASVCQMCLDGCRKVKNLFICQGPFSASKRNGGSSTKHGQPCEAVKPETDVEACHSAAGRGFKFSLGI